MSKSYDYNNVVLTGYVGSDPVPAKDAEKQFAACSLAENIFFKDKDGNETKRTRWHRLVFFGSVADVAKNYVKNGAHLLVVGELDYRTRKDENDKEYDDAQIIVREIKFLDKKVDA